MVLSHRSGSRRAPERPGPVDSRRTWDDVPWDDKRKAGSTPMTRVLVVEDDAQLARALVINLQARKYVVDAAPDGATALRLVAAEQPDMILLDLGLPDMDGLDVIKGLRGRSRAPVLVLSARSGSEDKIRALDAGADDYMTKPFSMDELLARLRAATRRTRESPPQPQTAMVVSTDAFTVDLPASRRSAAGATTYG